MCAWSFTVSQEMFSNCFSNYCQCRRGWMTVCQTCARVVWQGYLLNNLYTGILWTHNYPPYLMYRRSRPWAFKTQDTNRSHLLEHYYKWHVTHDDTFGIPFQWANLSPKKGTTVKCGKEASPVEVQWLKQESIWRTVCASWRTLGWHRHPWAYTAVSGRQARSCRSCRTFCAKARGPFHVEITERSENGK